MGFGACLRSAGPPGHGLRAVRGRPLPRPACRSSLRVPPQAGLAHLPPVGTLRDEPGHQEADDAPEHSHHYQRHRETVVRHGRRRSCQPLHHRLTLVPPGSVNTEPRDQGAQGPASRAPRDLAPTPPLWGPGNKAPPSPGESRGYNWFEGCCSFQS